MHDTPDTVQALVARFALRRRASTETFHAGVRLARYGKVTITGISDVELSAIVSDPDPLEVTLQVTGADELAGHCDCGATIREVCRHQVAVAHSLWADMETTAG